MKRIPLLTAAILTITCVGSSSLTANAALYDFSQITRNGNCIIISSGSNCDNFTLPDISGSCNNSALLDQIKDYLQNTVPNCSNNQTNNNRPEYNTPDNNKSDYNTSNKNNPNCNTSNENKQDCNTSKNNADCNTSNKNMPSVNTSDNNQTNNKKPDTNTSDKNTSDAGNSGNNNGNTGKPDSDKQNNKTENNNSNSNQSQNNTQGNTVPDQDTTENKAELTYINQVVSLVNAERTKAGLKALTIDSKLQSAAQVRAVEIETSFSHTRPNGTSFATAIQEQNISYRNAGENIAWGQRSPQEVVTAWMNSEGHRANIMNANFSKIGVGYQQNSRGVNYWSQLFTN